MRVLVLAVAGAELESSQQLDDFGVHVVDSKVEGRLLALFLHGDVEVLLHLLGDADLGLEALDRGLRVMDSTAISLCMENALPVIVFNLRQEGNLKRILLGKKIGTMVGTPLSGQEVP